MDLIIQVATQAHAVRLLQLFYLQHGSDSAGLEGANAEALKLFGDKTNWGGNSIKHKKKRHNGDSTEFDDASDPMTRMVGDSSALDGCVKVFPGTLAASDTPADQRRAFATSAIELGPFTNRRGPAAVLFAGVTVSPAVVAAWLKRSFVGRNVRRSFFFPRSAGHSGACHTLDEAVHRAWDCLVRIDGVDGVRIACDERPRDMAVAQIVRALSSAASGGGESGAPQEERPAHPLRLDPTRKASHVLCVFRIAVADLRAAGVPFPPSPDVTDGAAAAAPVVDWTAGEDSLKVAADAIPHRYVWSIFPGQYSLKQSWDEPATFGKDAEGGANVAHAVHKLDEALRVIGLVPAGGEGFLGDAHAGASSSSDNSSASTLAFADMRAGRSDMTEEEKYAWRGYCSQLLHEDGANTTRHQPGDNSLIQLRRAIDVGAAPGSWSMYMARLLPLHTDGQQSGVVVAVDPAQLNAAALATPKLVHICAMAGSPETNEAIHDALLTAGGDASTVVPQVDLLTCDANCLPHETIRNLVRPLLPHLKSGGWLVATLKFHGVGRNRGDASADCAKLLEGTGMLPGAVLWLLANTGRERTYVARKM